MRRKVAIIDPLGAHGSSHHFYLFGQLKGLKNNNIDVRLYTNNETDDPHIEGVRCFKFYKDIFKSNFNFINGIKWIIGSIISISHARFSSIKIFHFHIFYTNILVLFNLLLVKLFFGKVVLTIHDVSSFANPSSSSIIENSIYKLTDLILTHNEFSKLEIKRNHPELCHCIHIIPHGNYIPFIHIQDDKEKSREYLKISKDKKVLLFFGMIKEVKGLDILLHSLRDVLNENPDVMLLIAGKTWENDFANYQRIIDENNLSKNIILHDKFIPYEDVEYYYSASDLVVLPYKKIYQSGVLMMTLSYERPALVSNLPPLKEVITDNENGFLFNSEDVGDLSIRLNKILSDEDRLNRVRLNGNILIRKKFCWNEIARMTKKAYQTI